MARRSATRSSSSNCSSPKFAILDETDSGLDVDALKIVSEGVNRVKENTDLGVLLITHYTRILRYITPDFVHVFVDGRVAEEGGPELADRLEDEGYDRFLAGAALELAMAVPLAPALFDQVEEALKDVMDPELGVNIIDLGLVYDVNWDEDNDALVISMTLTSAACPLTDMIEEQISESLDGVVDAFRINWVWMPPWGPDKINDDGRDTMRALGFSI